MKAGRTAVGRTARAFSAALLLGHLAACSSSTVAGSGATGTAPSPSVSPSSSPLGDEPTDSPGPADVANDAPVEDEPGSDVDVVVSYAGVEPGGTAVEVAGFVTGLVEAGGRCSLVLNRSGHDERHVDGEAVPDAQSTSCALLSVPVDRLAPGTWTARLEYRSGTSSGSSDEVPVVIP